MISKLNKKHFITIGIAVVMWICLWGWLNMEPRGPMKTTVSYWPEGKPEGYWWGVYKGWPLQFQELEHHQVRTWEDTEFGKVFGPTDIGASKLPKDAQGKPVLMDPDKMSWALYFPGLGFEIASACVDLVVLALGILGILWVGRKLLNRHLKGSDTGTIPDTMPNTMPPK